MEYARPSGEHPFTCHNCALQYRHLKDLLNKRRSCSLAGVENRVGLKGMNRRYSRKDEIEAALDEEVRQKKEMERKVRQLTKIKLSQKEWESVLYDSCLNGDEEKLLLDLAKLFKMGVSKTNPIQVMVLRNLTSKLLKKNNNHYVDIIKDISGLFRNELGTTNYALLANIFGLAGNTTAASHSKGRRLEAGLNITLFDEIASVFKDLPINESSDGARALRYLQPRLNKANQVVLLGKSWDPNVARWSEENITIPRKNSGLGDQDDFTALKRLVDDLITKDMLSKTVSIHNFTALASLEKPTLLYCLWPTRDKGYKAAHLLKYWENLRRLCFYDEHDNPRRVPINLLTYSTDSAGFSLSAALKLMTPTLEEVKDNVLFLGLGIDEERFLAPYYWRLPSIAALDYDHEQRLFLKNLKYETRELTFWEDANNTTIASIGHLKDLKDRCQNMGLDCGFSNSDLILVYFCDQNSDACERLFTQRTADLLDEYIPGSQGTSLYIRAVYSLIEPFRKISFGSPAEIQESVSCGITVLRFWRRILMLRKMALHSKPGAKAEPAKRGKFITYGCYSTAEIIFAAASHYQLAMFLHFKALGLMWSSPGSCGTKATERIISEIQGKTTEIQCLDSQPTFADMLDRSTKVQYNLNVKKDLAQAGAKVRQSSNRRQMAFSFQKHQENVHSYSYPDTYVEFRCEQKEAHYRGVKRAQALVQKYLPERCTDLLKSSGFWVKPSVFKQPDGIKIVSEIPPNTYNKLDRSYADIKDSIVKDEVVDLEESEDINSDNEDDEDDLDDETEEVVDLEHDDDVKDNHPKERSEKWMISRLVNGKLVNIHIKGALKLVLPREYISRSRNKRHIASKYLPDKAPINPNHNVVRFGNVALKSVYRGKRVYDVVRIESIQSTKDGKDIKSFSTNSPSSLRVRGSMYGYDNAVYKIKSDVLLTPWKSPSSVIGPVELIPLEGEPGCYNLHHESQEKLYEMGFIPKGDVTLGDQEDSDLSESEHEEEELPEGFYEVESVLAKRFSKTTHSLEYKVHFKGYGEEDDMWLPASCFNRVLNFESQSRYGRKRHHKVDPENEDSKNCTAKKKQGNSKTGEKRMPKSNNRTHKKTRKQDVGKRSRQRTSKSLNLQKEICSGESDLEEISFEDIQLPTEIKQRVKRSRDQRTKAITIESTDSEDSTSGTKHSHPILSHSHDENQEVQRKVRYVRSTSPKVNKRKRRKPCKQNIGKCFRQSLNKSLQMQKGRSSSENDHDEIDCEEKQGRNFNPSTEKAKRSRDQSIDKSDSEEITAESRPSHISSSDDENEELSPRANSRGNRARMIISSDENDEEGSLPAADSNNCQKNYSNCPELSLNILRESNEFKVSRRQLSQLRTPRINFSLKQYVLCSNEKSTVDPLEVNEIPPETTIDQCEKELSEQIETSARAYLHNYGCIGLDSIRLMRKVIWLKEVQREVAFEINWLQQAFKDYKLEEQRKIEMALLDNLVKEKHFKVHSFQCNISAFELATLCGERYLSDEILTFMISLWCSRTNEAKGKTAFVVLSPFLAEEGNQFEAILRNAAVNIKFNEVEAFFWPYFMKQKKHWGLCVFWLRESTVRFDDGLHCPFSMRIKRRCSRILDTLHDITGQVALASKSWKFERFKDPMPDQNLHENQGYGSGSCGVGVILAARDLINGIPFLWSFVDSMYHRAALMLQIVNFGEMQ